MKKFLCSLFYVFLVFLSFPVVKAENAYQIPPSVETQIYNLNGVPIYWRTDSTNADIRVVYLGNSSSGTVYIFSTTRRARFIYKAGDTSNSLTASSYYEVGNQTYFYNYMSTGSDYYKTQFLNGFYYAFGAASETNNDATAFYYTFGEGAEFEPTPTPIMYSALANVGYNTKIAGSGQAAINNLDTVSWNPETDTVGNDISNMSVSIRAVPGKYSASSRQNLYEKLYSDFVLNTLGATVLDTVSASSGSFSITWANVIDKLSIPFATISSILDQDGTFIKNGWIYQVRLEGDGYTGEWQTVYTATSSGVENDLTIIQSTTINQTLVNTITEINQLNNTSNNWYINETTINMSDYTEPSEGNKPWWAYLLEAIVSLINKLVDGISSIVGAIAELVGNIIDGILGLFTFDSFSVPDFSTQQQNIHDNSGIFGESIDILQTMNQTISNADSSAEPILYYPGIDLEGVEFIPEITINLNDYVEELGLTQWHNLAYTCTDILIWTSLIYTIYRKLIGVFKK